LLWTLDLRNVIAAAQLWDRRLCGPAAASYPIHSDAGHAAEAITELRHVQREEQMPSLDEGSKPFGTLIKRTNH
jgi:hypothetical protein